MEALIGLGLLFMVWLTILTKKNRDHKRITRQQATTIRNNAKEIAQLKYGKDRQTEEGKEAEEA